MSILLHAPNHLVQAAAGAVVRGDRSMVLEFVWLAAVTSLIAACSSFALDDSPFGLTHWLRFFLGDVLGLVTVTLGLTSVIYSIGAYRKIAPRHLVEAGLVAATCIAALGLVFVIQDIQGFQVHGYIAVPILSFIGWRFGTSGVAATVLFLAFASVAFTSQGREPFAVEPSLDESTSQVQLFIAFTSVPMLALAAELSSRRRAQAELDGLQSRLLRSERLSTLRLVAGSAAHDLRNLLQVPLAGIAMLERDRKDDPDLMEELTILRETSMKARSLLSRLLDAGDAQGSVHAGDALIQLAPILSRLAPPGLTVRVEAESGGPLLRLPREGLERVVLNLVSNACDACLEGGLILVKGTTSSDGWFSLIVQDNGKGIGRENLERIWEPFFTTKGSGRGTGLGLASVRAAIHAGGGTATIESQIGVGTTITAVFPIEPALPADERRG